MRYLPIFVLLFVVGVATLPMYSFAAPIVAGSFSTTWDTSTTGTFGESNSNQVTFSLGSGADGETCSGVVYWEEIGNDSNSGTSTLDSNCNEETITFPSEGNYRVDISGTFPSFRSPNDSHKLRTVEQWGDNLWESFRRSFSRTNNLIFNAVDIPNLSNVTNFDRMFFRATGFNSPLNSWDVSNVTNMSSMFAFAESFNQPLDNWDVSNVTSFGVSEDSSGMFAAATAFNQDLSSWNIAAATDMGNMFDFSGLSRANYSAMLNAWSQLGILQSFVTLGAANITYNETATSARQFLIDTYSWTINDADLFTEPSDSRFITRWDTTLAAPTNQVKFDISGSGANFYIDWGDGNTDYYSSAPDTVTHTYATSGIKTITFIGNIPQFYFCYGDQEANKIIDVLQWGTNAWQNLSYAFQDCSNITGFTAQDTPNLSQVTAMNSIFDGAVSLDQDISDWDISNITNLTEAFRGSGISVSTYTRLLLDWSQQTILDSAGLGTVGGTYDNGLGDYINLTPYCSLAQSARDIMTGTYNWSITDGGPVSCQTATYSSSEGGALSGDISQYIVDGESGEAVTAIPDSGYRFVSWSDGSVANPRTDSNLTSSLTVTAIFAAAGAGGNSNSGTKVGVRA